MAKMIPGTNIPKATTHWDTLRQLPVYKRNRNMAIYTKGGWKPLRGSMADCVRESLTPIADYLGQLAVANKPSKSAANILTAAADHMAERASQRDTSGGERAMSRTVAAFNAMYGTNLTEVQGWQFMVLLKMSRASAGAHVADDYEDQTAYSALAGECANREG